MHRVREKVCFAKIPRQSMNGHLSTYNIFALQHVLNRRIPLLKFFIKQQLLYVPIMGLAWWALDFPFMKRHSAAALKRNPALREQDRETTRRACEKFALVPTSLMNFTEGTRFTPAKHAAQGSPYRHLLKPRTGALALALHAMGRQFHSLLDVTLAYPDGVPTFWQFLCGRGTGSLGGRGVGSFGGRWRCRGCGGCRSGG